MSNDEQPSFETSTRPSHVRLQVFCRSDYHLATAGVAALARREPIDLDQRCSDHARSSSDCDFTL